jgi:iron donor protein CyaY
MTESRGDEPALFERIRLMVDERGVDIRLIRTGNALRLEFADGQRIVVNFDVRSNSIWLASRSGGIEFVLRNGAWRAHDRGDFFAKLAEMIEQTIACDPLNARKPDARTSLPAEPSASAIANRTARPRALRYFGIALLVVAAGFWAAHRLHPSRPETHTADQTLTLSLNKLHYACQGALPANGSITLFPDGGVHPGSPNDPAIILHNAHSHAVLLILSAPHAATAALSILVRARQAASVHLPAGHYDMMFSVGDTWCNPRSGFSEGQLLKFGKPLIVQAGDPLQLTMQTSGPGMDDFQLIEKRPHDELDVPPPTYTSDGRIEVLRHKSGNFYLPATIEGVPLTFMVDTGAAVTSISSDLARQAGISNCKEVQLQSADSANGCVAFLPRMMLGKFVVKNITVAVMPHLDVNVLGANVLQNFRISQDNNSMLIGKH